MNPAQILADLRQAGVRPEVVEGGRLSFPAGVLTDPMRQAIRQHRAELLALLCTETADVPDVTAPAPWQEAAARYYVHHFVCCDCIASGRGYTAARCVAGQFLWGAYAAAFVERQDLFG